MPELPEVESVRRSLEPLIKGVKVAEVVVYDDTVFGDAVSRQRLTKELLGRRVVGVARRGKFLLLQLDGGWWLIVHLRMTGQFYVLDQKMAAPERLRLLLTLSNGLRLCFNDLRRFGRVWLVQDKELATFKPWLKLAPDPLEQRFDRQVWRQALQRRRGPIKAALLDQSVLSGLGNIYADEALFRAGIHPLTPANTLAPDEAFYLLKEIQELLHSSIKWGGTTYSDYVNGLGQPGEFAQHLCVYRRGGKSCRNCKATIQRVKLGGRGTHFCPECQPAPVV